MAIDWSEWLSIKPPFLSEKRVITTFLSRKLMIMRLSIAFEDVVGSSIAPQVMPPCERVLLPSPMFIQFLGRWRWLCVCVDMHVFICFCLSICFVYLFAYLLLFVSLVLSICCVCLFKSISICLFLLSVCVYQFPFSFNLFLFVC